MQRSNVDSVVRFGLAAILILVGFVPGGSAQSSSRFGTWKLDTTRSASSASGPKSLVRTDEPAGNGVKVTYEGVAADGSRIAYSYTAQYDGKEYRSSGVGMAFGWETIALRRIDDHTTEATLRRGGKVVSIARNVVSPDGKTMTVTSKFDESGQPTRVSTSIWVRQP